MASEKTSVARVARDLAHLQQNADLSLAAAHQDEDITRVRALIIGPPDTPYEHGFFEFAFTFPDRYPMTPPKVTCITTNRGRTRFNPNIYANGKVCLTILGTWEGMQGEQWSCCQSLESVLISIQSLMGSNPYENEPGHEASDSQNKTVLRYANKIRHETLRISVIERMEDILGLSSPQSQQASETQYDEMPEYDPHDEDDPTVVDDADWQPFQDLFKRRFLWYHDSYLQAIDDASTRQKDGTNFERTVFECGSNGMRGTFQYQQLKDRLHIIVNAMNEETNAWIAAGLIQTKKSTAMAHNLGIQFTQITADALNHKANQSNFELNLPNSKNVFEWQLTIFGEVMTNLDGSVFRVQLVIPVNFPEVWPRARMLTAIHHRNVSSIGTICYQPGKPDNLASHIEAILAAIDDKNPRYDPRSVVSPLASAQFWSTDQKKEYTRQLRRSARDSTEG